MMQTAERTRFTEAEMATVRDTDLPDLLISLGYQVKRIGRYYTTQEMDSIRIKDRRTWFRYSEGIGEMPSHSSSGSITKVSRRPWSTC